MPYIDPKNRVKYATLFTEIQHIFLNLEHKDNEGELNYLVSAIVACWLNTLGREPRYADYNAIWGVLQGAAQEFYRIKIAPYEDHKRHINGDVY